MKTSSASTTNLFARAAGAFPVRTCWTFLLLALGLIVEVRAQPLWIENSNGVPVISLHARMGWRYQLQFSTNADFRSYMTISWPCPGWRSERGCDHAEGDGRVHRTLPPWPCAGFYRIAAWRPGNGGGDEQDSSTTSTEPVVALPDAPSAITLTHSPPEPLPPATQPEPAAGQQKPAGLKHTDDEGPD